MSDNRAADCLRAVTTNDPAVLAAALDHLLAAVDDLWSFIDEPEVRLLQESTRQVAQLVHEELHHGVHEN